MSTQTFSAGWKAYVSLPVKHKTFLSSDTNKYNCKASLHSFPTILLRKHGILSETCTKNLGHLGKKGHILKNHIFHRPAATHIYASAL